MAIRARLGFLITSLALSATLAGCSGLAASVAGPRATMTATLEPSGGAPTATPWPQGPGAWQPLTDCKSAPATYQTIYQAGLGSKPEQGSATHVTFQRSDDCGATWTNLTPPTLSGVVYNANVQALSVFANPLNPHVAYLTIQTDRIISSPPCISSVPSPAATPTPASGGIGSAQSSFICQWQFITQDSGKTWKPLKLPKQGVLGELSPELNASLSLIGNLRPQGSRLYGVITNAALDAGAIVPPGRLVASDDGGLTWKLVDAGIAAQKLGVWDFAPTPSGKTIYAVAEPWYDPARKPPSYAATLSIWRSPDGGATWQRIGSTPGATSGKLVEGMVAGSPSGASHTLYLMTGDQNGRAILGSVDDGAIWQGDSQLAYLDHPGATVGLPTLVGTLPDGSVVAINPYGGSPVLAWRPNAAPRAIAASVPLSSYGNPVFQKRSDGVYMWLMGQQGGQSGLLIRYTKLLGVS